MFPFYCIHLTRVERSIQNRSHKIFNLESIQNQVGIFLDCKPTLKTALILIRIFGVQKLHLLIQYLPRKAHQNHSPSTPFTPKEGTEYTPQCTNIPIFASSNQLGPLCLSRDSHVGSYFDALTVQTEQNTIKKTLTTNALASAIVLFLPRTG